VAALTNVVVIATHTRNRAAAERALQQLEPLLLQQGDEAGNPAFKRGQQAQIAYLEGWTAARRGDYASAQKQADRITQLLAPDANPRKLEPMHQLEGFIALYQASTMTRPHTCGRAICWTPTSSIRSQSPRRARRRGAGEAAVPGSR